jgi:hypothetical protein
VLAAAVLSYCGGGPLAPTSPPQVARGRAIIPANKRHLELEPTIIGEGMAGVTIRCHLVLPGV